MKRPLLWCAGAYALGEVLALQSGGLWIAAFFLAAAACLGFWRTKAAGPEGLPGIRPAAGNRRILWLVLSVFFVLGWLRVYQAGDSQILRRLDGDLAEEESLEGILSGRAARLELRNGEGGESFRLLLSGCVFRPEGREACPVGGVLVTLEELPEGVREGRELTMKARLLEMEESGNPGQFDGRSYYRSQGISYRAKGTALLEASGRTDYLRMGLRLLRQYFSDNLYRTAGDKSGGMLCAMVLGEKWEADGDMVSLYTDSGMGHLLAISGLHISLAGMGVYRLLRKRLKCPYGPAAFGCAAMSFCYYLLTGEGTSAGRAFFMLTVYGIGQVLGRQYDLASAAALSALVMLIRRPLLLFQSGFLLSFGSVLALGLLYPLFLQAELPKLLSPFFPGLSIQLLTLPAQVFFFYKIPVYSLFLNMAVLPLFTAGALLGMAGALLGGVLPGILAVLLYPARWILWLYGFLGEASLRLPGAVWRTGRPEIWQLLLYGLLLFLFVRRLGKRAAPFLLLGMLLCLMPVRYRGMELVFLDVGQGDCCFVRTPEGTTFFIDGGSSDQRSVGEYRLEPFLDVRAEGRVDFALVSHGDADHINGIGELIKAGRIGTLVLPRGREGKKGLAALKEQAEQAGIPVCSLGCGERLLAGDAVFTCLWPEAPGGAGSGRLDENEASMVLWLSWKELDVLFTGDLEGDGEAEAAGYLEAYRRDSGRTADILKVPHHGSGKAASAAFLETVSPWYGVISCGKHNGYGHPAGETLERLAQAGCRVLRTDRGGAVTIRSDGKKLEVYEHRRGTE